MNKKNLMAFYRVQFEQLYNIDNTNTLKLLKQLIAPPL